MAWEDKLWGELYPWLQDKASAGDLRVRERQLSALELMARPMEEIEVNESWSPAYTSDTAQRALDLKELSEE